MSRSGARLCTVLVIVTVSGFASAAPVAAAEGVTVQITQLPGEFVAGGPPAPVTVVASRSRGGCIKLRWSLALRVDEARPDRVRVDRIEQDGPFPVDTEVTGNAARVTDQRLDPGTLCRNRTVTAQYEITFPGDATGEVTLVAEAFSAGGELLDRTTVTRGIRPAETSPTPEPAPGAAAGAAAPAQSGAASQGAADRVSDEGVVRIGPIGLAAGALMVLLGLGLLVRVRRRSRSLRPISRRTTQRRGRTRQPLTLPPVRR
jgi:hypothetical protein